MAVEFILGASGTGKTQYIYEKMIVQSMEENHPPIWFILPEQSNMAAEQEMVTRHPMHGTMDISIVSFSRLAFKVFDERNVHTYDILDDYGKSMLITRVLRDCRDELRYYGKMQEKTGFVEQIKSMISEFYQYRITENQLDAILAELPQEKSLYAKLSDMKCILHAFEDAMRDSYMVAEQLLALLSQVLPESELLRGAEIYLDGFTGFTPIQYQVLEALMQHAANLHFVFTMDEKMMGDNRQGEDGLFFMGRESVDHICKLAGDHGIPVLPHVGMRKNYRQKPDSMLSFLEQHMFRYPSQVYSGSDDSVHVVQCENAEQEISCIAGMIRTAVMQGKYRYGDFAVVTGDLGSQAHQWHRICDMLQIPYFLDVSESLACNPVAEVCDRLFDLYIRDFDMQAVFSLLKTGFLDVPRDAVCLLENYVLKYGVRGYAAWSKPFRGGVKGLASVNAVRQQFMEYLGEESAVFRKTKAKAGEYLTALYHFMVSNQMPQKLAEQCAAFETAGLLRQAKSYDQVYDKLIAVMDKTMDILGDTEIDRQTLRDMLLAGMSDLSLGVIPSTLDQVVIGDMERTRLSHVKVLFVAGANEGLLPAQGSGKGLLADQERRQLAALGVSLAPDQRREVFIQQYYMYLQFTQASEQLYISYRKKDETDAQMRISYPVKRMLELLPDVSVQEAETLRNPSLPLSEAEMTELFADHLERETMTDSTLYHAMRKRKGALTARLTKGYLYYNRETALDHSVARKLYGTHMVHSVSRLETYVGCAYRFFLQYGIGLAKREEYQVETTQIGTILHAVMEMFFQAAKDGKIDLSQISESERAKMVATLVRQAAADENETIFDSSLRYRHQLDVLTRIAVRCVGHLCRHLGEGDMRPLYLEKEFSPSDHLSYTTMTVRDGVTMELKGIVDRVDIRETEDAVYVKVLDYKSGEKNLDYVKLYEGNQLQLTVYMNVILELLQRQYPDKRVIPTGMFYYHMYDPILEATDDEELEKMRIKNSRLTGLTNTDPACLMHMDGGTGQVTPVQYKKDGTFVAGQASLVTTEELEYISAFVRKKLKQVGEQIADGQIEMNPEKGEKSGACGFCDFKSVCRFEPGLGGNAYRIAPQLGKQEAKSRIMEEGSTDAMDE